VRHASLVSSFDYHIMLHSLDSVSQPTSSASGRGVGRIKLVALDLDGTILRNDHTFSPRTLTALRDAMDQSVYVTIATGRSAATVRTVAATLGLNAPVICQHGGIVTDLRTGEVLRHVTVASDVVCDVLHLASEHPSWHPVIFRGDEIIVSEMRLRAQEYSLSGIQPTVLPDPCGALTAGDPDKLMIVLDPSETAAALRSVSEFVGDRATVVQSSRRLVEVHAHAAHKGAALAHLAAHLGLDQSEVMAIGDQDNDETMLAWAGLGVAMGNGSPRAKAAADWVAPTIDEDGAAVAVERFV
jgi:Cof subfamily protein (haloacid dehalogenase superfamily)